jgi:hypothetical protein
VHFPKVVTTKTKRKIAIRKTERFSIQKCISRRSTTEIKRKMVVTKKDRFSIQKCISWRSHYKNKTKNSDGKNGEVFHTKVLFQE